MNIAVISFDQDFIKTLAKKLPDSEVKGYTDSLSFLREISFFNPEVIIYDATGGEIALNALEFFLSRDQIKGKTIKVLISKENPIDQENLSRFENLDFYYKETDIDKLVNDLSQPQQTAVKEEPPSIESFEETYQPPTDMEALLGETVSSEPAGEIDLTMETESLDDVSDLLKEIEAPKPEELAPNEPEPQPPEKKEVVKPEPQPVQNSGTLKITIEISPEELRNTVIQLAVEKLVEEIKEDIDIKKIKEDLQKDFFDRLEKELKESTEEIKSTVKEKLFETVEADLKDKVRESIKEDVTKITTDLVKEKLEQVFGSK
ncbi:MAG TPA: hypothetical protein ENK22_01855 [Persephonella sp.]|nr:hypothetical protein [Persephonella sp.]